ncbi:sulfotransferase ssu-1-like [Ixodes scapularis]
MTESYREIDGYYVSYSFHDETIRSALGYKPAPGDVFIVSYPKCGTTWLQHIVYSIFNGRAPPGNRMGILREMPFLEMQGVESIKDMPRPGAIKTHMPFQFQPYSKDAKYLYITRNPYDCCVSFFYHTKGLPHYNFADGTFDEFFEMFIEGKVDTGDYFDNLLSWYEHRNDPNVLFLTYEDLKEDTAAWVLKIAHFLGEEYGIKLRANPRALDEVIEQTNMVSMRKHVNKGLESFFVDVKAIPEERRPRWLRLMMESVGEEGLKKPMITDFVRKGVVGDWKGHFSAEQVRRFKERIASKIRGSDVMDLWKYIDLP